MSVSASTDRAIYRIMCAEAKKDPQPTQPAPPAAEGGGGGGAAAKTAPDPPDESTLGTIAAYIPSEIVAAYLAATSLLASAMTKQGKDQAPDDDWPQFAIFMIFLVATPIFVWLVHRSQWNRYSKNQQAAPKGPASPPQLPDKRVIPVHEIITNTLAFAVWGFALPNTPFAVVPGYSSVIVGALLPLAAVAFGALAPRPAPAATPAATPAPDEKDTATATITSTVDGTASHEAQPAQA